MRSNSTTREARAIELIQSGAVSIFPGRDYAIVQGSGKVTYRVSRDGCECQDWVKRGEQVGPCKHMIAARATCDGIRILRTEAQQTGRVRLPANVGRALHEAALRTRRTAQLTDELFGAA